MYKLKYMFDWGSGVCLWSMNKAAEEKFGDYPVSTDTLPVSQKLKDELEYLIKKHDEALNWNDPAADLLWDNTQIQAFENAAKRTYKMLCDELGADYEIEFYKRIF
ncbi:MAG: hypothetical protein IJ201_10425 [Solobacterium sp.]|nr:hypothetical protein [Solobacterium sp.]